MQDALLVMLMALVPVGAGAVGFILGVVASRFAK